jgi:hypothetical protein
MAMNIARVLPAPGTQGTLLETSRFDRVMGCWAHRDIGLHAHEEIQMTFNLGAGRLHYKIDDALVVVAHWWPDRAPDWVRLLSTSHFYVT